jgi:hypothetical protein
MRLVNRESKIQNRKFKNPWLVSSTGSHPTPPNGERRVENAEFQTVLRQSFILHSPFSILHLEGLGRSIYFAFRDSKWYARPVTLRDQALQYDSAYKAAPGGGPPLLFELRALPAKRPAECRGLAPHARRHALVSTEGPGGLPSLRLSG